MSETFDAALRGAYERTAAAPGARLDAALPMLVARTRRNRRVRAAGTLVATAAVVAGVAVAGTALVQDTGGSPVPPAEDPITEPTVGTITGTVTELTCGTTLANVKQVPDGWGVSLRLELEWTDPAPATLPGWVAIATDDEHGAWRDVDGGGMPDGVGFAVVRDGVVVGTAQANLWEVPDIRGVRETHDARVSPRACDGGTLPPGSYELVASLPVDVGTDDDTWVTALLLSEPAAFTFAEVGALPEPTRHDTVEYHSTVPPTDPAVPLRDGSYLGIVQAVDPAAGTVTADLVVLHFGQGAIDWVAANDPGAEIVDDYVMEDSDGPTPRTLPISPGAPVYEWSPSEAGLAIALRAGGVAEWAAAPTDDRERRLEDGPAMPRGGLYWLDVRDGVVQQVVGQYVP